MNKDSDIEKYIFYVKLYMKRLENIDDAQAEQLINSYKLREWFTEEPKATHYEPRYLAYEIIRTKMAHFR